MKTASLTTMIALIVLGCSGGSEQGSTEPNRAARAEAVEGEVCCHLVGPWHDVYKCVGVGSEDECFEACINEEYEGRYCHAYFTTEEECSPSCGYVP
jgi:hypothetical protein